LLVTAEVHLSLADKEGGHDVDHGERVELVGLVDMVVAVGEGVGAQLAHLHQEEQQQH
jgi:hypothetical protein